MSTVRTIFEIGTGKTTTAELREEEARRAQMRAQQLAVANRNADDERGG